MSLISNIYSIEGSDDIIKYIDNYVEFYFNPIDIIIDSIFDSTIGNVVNKNVIIKLLNFNSSKNILNPGKLIYVNNKILSIETIGSNDITCLVRYDLYSGDQDYNINNTFVYLMDIDRHDEIFKLSNKYAYISKIRSVEFLDSNNIINYLLNNIDCTINSGNLYIMFKGLNNSSDENIRKILYGFYLNIQIYSFDIISKYFNIKIKKSYDIFSGIIYDFTNNFINMPHLSFKINNTDYTAEVHKINLNTNFEKTIEDGDKIVLFINISTENIEMFRNLNVLESSFIYKIIS